MGCSIHSFAEKRNKETNKWEMVGDVFTLSDYYKKHMKKEKNSHPFYRQSYSTLAFLADVRNYNHCEPLVEPKGIPKDVCETIRSEWENWFGDGHSASFLTAKELLEFDYDKEFWNRRISRTTIMPDGIKFTDGASTANEGEGAIISYRENLDEMFFIHLEELKSLGEPDDVRIVFWFDN
jgi:hypothetical protein